MRVQLWSYNYDPEPQGIAPLSAMLAQALRARGHDLLVVAAHPHYPEAAWGRRRTPYRETRDGVPILRLPLWIGRGSGLARVRQEASFAAAQAIAAPFLPKADAIVAVTPCFPALASAMFTAKARRIPWVIWLQDIVTDAAATTGLLDDASVGLRAARRLEQATHRSAARTIVISEAFRTNLAAKGVPDEKMVRIFNPSSRHADGPNDLTALAVEPPKILAMGNIGHSQGLDRIVEAFEESDELRALGATLQIAGSGVAAHKVRASIRSDAIQMLGVRYGDEFEPILRSASIGLVSQRADVLEFNLPSKLMNLMAYGIPVIASVRLGSETARIVEESGGGWVTDATNPAQFTRRAAEVLGDPDALALASAAGYAFAAEHFRPASVAQRFETVLEAVIAEAAPPGA